ncbi:GrpB-like predicted nucleotidyltransferase (UPF0157 family) [Scopulibacillus daqui]|uniref:GrpB-like predicted nucleotidyltransferase (UPF0157 family) n=1 Tax=Scopulibacillus daqui TaxID=1469162 RepID=A0ABS2PWS9_9BACL|nr:GrpB family protein [Scopulibacillus daqui]MBM7644518.1 GrpB-like predicted nucleotidyltransferase (UPF0157 family) [Scopulibacillus daqui]
MRKVEVTPYHPRWTRMFNEEADQLRDVFGSVILDIHHIGSTSVEGLKAKPIIDMMPVVRDIHNIDGFNKAMIAMGYEPMGENGIPGRRFFQKGGDNRTHHIHMYQLGNPEIERHLAFRDYLRAHPKSAKEYGNLKEALAQQFPYDIESYIKGKEQLVTDIEQKALAWYRRKT